MILIRVRNLGSECVTAGGSRWRQGRNDEVFLDDATVAELEAGILSGLWPLELVRVKACLRVSPPVASRGR